MKVLNCYKSVALNSVHQTNLKYFTLLQTKQVVSIWSFPLVYYLMHPWLTSAFTKCAGNKICTILNVCFISYWKRKWLSCLWFDSFLACSVAQVWYFFITQCLTKVCDWNAAFSIKSWLYAGVYVFWVCDNQKHFQWAVTLKFDPTSKARVHSRSPKKRLQMNAGHLWVSHRHLYFRSL